MLAQALQAEVDAYLKAAEGERDEHGRALVVRNGYARSREVLCGVGTIEVRTPRIDDKRVDEETGERKGFKARSCRRTYAARPRSRRPCRYSTTCMDSPAATSRRPWRSSSERRRGLSPASVVRLTEQWRGQREAFMERDLSEGDYVYVWVDGIHMKVRPGGDDRLCCW